MRDFLSFAAIVAGSLILIAVAAFLAYDQGCRYTDRQIGRLRSQLADVETDLNRIDDVAGHLTNRVFALRDHIDTEARKCDSWHDLVSVHKHAIAALTARVDHLEKSGLLPDVDPVGELLFAQTARDFLLPMPPAIDTRPHADIPGHVVGRAAPWRPADNSETGFTREHVDMVKAISGELVIAE